MLEIINDDYYMDLAFSMASKTIGQTGINPVVGIQLSSIDPSSSIPSCGFRLTVS